MIIIARPYHPFLTRIRLQKYKAATIHLHFNSQGSEVVEPYLDVGVVVGCLRETQSPRSLGPPRKGISEHLSHVVWDLVFGKKTVCEVSVWEPAVSGFGIGSVVVSLFYFKYLHRLFNRMKWNVFLFFFYGQKLSC